MLAARGARDLDGGEEPVADEEQARRLRRQARGVHLRAAAFALLLTLMTLLLPR